MSDIRIHSLLSLALTVAPLAATSPSITPQTEIVSQRTSLRKMKYLLAAAPRLAMPQIPQSAIEQYSCTGTLKENEDGFVYVDIDDNYIHELVHFIESDGFEEPPYFGATELVGAHISVMYAGESRGDKIVECGQEIRFTPLECKIIHPLKWESVESVYLIEVDCPELDQLRAKYGLPKNPYPFHITVGIKPKN